MNNYQTALRLMAWDDELSLPEAYNMVGIAEEPPQLKTREDQLNYLEERLRRPALRLLAS